MRLLLVILILATMTGCGSRPRDERRAERSTRDLGRFAELTGEETSAAVRKNSDKAQVVFVPFNYEKTVMAEDAAQFSRFALEYYRGRGLADFRQSADVIRDATEILDGGKTISKDWAYRHGLDMIASGTVHRYDYRLSQESLEIHIDATTQLLDAATGDSRYMKRQQVTRQFKVNRDASDFSQENRETLDDLLGKFLPDLKNLPAKSVMVAKAEAKPAEAEATKSAPVIWGDKTDQAQNRRQQRRMQRRGARVVSSDTIENSKTPAPTEAAAAKPNEPSQIKVTRLPESVPGTEPSPTEPQSTSSDRIEALRERLKQSMQKPSSAIKVVATKEAQPEPEVELERKALPGDLDLQMEGLYLIQPQALDASKRYEKFFYLPKTTSSFEDTKKSFDMASRSNLTLEVFVTISDYAVRKFLLDYFEGAPANPVGRIPEAWERLQMGKYQLGFMLGQKAFILTAPRENRDLALQGAGGLFVRNGGKDLQKILSVQEKSATKVASVSQTPKTVSPQVEKIVVQAPKAATSQVIKKEEVLVRKLDPQRGQLFLDTSRKFLQAEDFEMALKFAALARDEGNQSSELNQIVAQASQKLSRTQAAPVVTTLASELPATKAQVLQVTETVAPATKVVVTPKSTSKATETLLTQLEYEEAPENPRATIETPVKVEPEKAMPAPEVVPTPVIAAAPVNAPAVNAAPVKSAQTESERISSLLNEIRLPVIPARPLANLPKAEPGLAQVLADESSEDVAILPTLPQTGKDGALRTSARKELIEDFYAEMEKIEAELEQVRSRRTNLMTVAPWLRILSPWELFFQAVMLFGLTMLVLGFFRERNMR